MLELKISLFHDGLRVAKLKTSDGTMVESKVCSSSLVLALLNLRILNVQKSVLAACSTVFMRGLITMELNRGYFLIDGSFCFALILIGIAAYAITVWLFPFDDEK